MGVRRMGKRGGVSRGDIGDEVVDCTGCGTGGLDGGRVNEWEKRGGKRGKCCARSGRHKGYILCAIAKRR